MPKYRLLALDLDGTVLTDDRQVSEATRTWIRRAVDAGVVVLLATGRGLEMTGDLWAQLGPGSPAVLLNGAEIWESPGNLIARHFIPQEDIGRLHRTAVESCAFFWGYSVEGLAKDRDWTDEMLGRRWMKFGMRHDDRPTIGRLRRTVEGWGTVEVTHGTETNMEVGPKGMTKETGVRTVCQRLGIGMEQVMAIGDSCNDLALIRSVGLGVAMGNADDALKRVAHAVTAANEQDGVAEAIRRHLLDGDQRVSR